ncbi:hypothetical protein LTR94_026978, partial [Friedmanniomyces endolithicus]
PARKLARLHARAGHPTYLYRFDVTSAENRQAHGGASHAVERPYVFGNLGILPYPVEDRDRRASEAMMGYWTAFARTGDPNGGALPRGPAFDAAGSRIEIDNQGVRAAREATGGISALAGVAAAIPARADDAADARLKTDWPWLGRYAEDNRRLIASGARTGIVFMGDSITQGWIDKRPGFFTAGRVDRGIGGQTTPQMLCRMMADVVALKQQLAQAQAAARNEPVAAGADGSVPNPAYLSLQAMLADKQSAVAALQMRKRQLQGDLDLLNSKLAGDPEVAAEQGDIDRNYDVLKQQYDQLLAQREQVKLRSSAQSQTDAVKFSVIDPPTVPRTPTAPNRPLLLLSVLVVGIGAGIGALAGAGVGQYMDGQQRALEAELSGTGVGVARQGDNLVLRMPSDVTFPSNESNLDP